MPVPTGAAGHRDDDSGEADPRHRRHPIEHLFEAMERGGRAGRSALPHFTALVAMCVIVTYSIGLIRRVATLHAEGIPPVRAIPLDPLQTNFVLGLSVILQPSTVVVTVLTAVVILTVGRRLVDRALDSSTGARAGVDDDGSTRALKERLRRVAPAALLAVPLVIPPVYFAPGLVLGGTAGLALAVVARWLMRQPHDASAPLTRDAAHRVRRIGIGLLGLSSVLIIALQTWFTPPPLDRVQLRMLDRTVLQGRLVTQSPNAIYMVGLRPSDRAVSTPLRAVPLARVRDLEIRDGQPRRYRTILQSLGVPFLHWDRDRGFRWGT